MTNTNFYPNQTSNQHYQKLSKHNVRDFLLKHRLLSMIILITIVVTLFIAFGLIFFSSASKESTQEPEDPPFITFQNENLLEHPILNDEIIFNLNLILLNKNEINSAPSTNTEKEYIASVKQDSFSLQDNQEASTFTIDISDGRKYILNLLVNIEFDDEYAVMILDRTDKPDAQDYVITFTNLTSEYYSNLGNADNTTATSSTVDHITGKPLNPLSNSAINWIESFNLTNPETIHSTLPSIR